MFVSAMALTAVNLLLRLVGTSFQVYLSSRIGAAGIGLLQLVMSVGSLAMIGGMAGVRTAAMYLSAEELGKHRRDNLPWVLSGCFLYSIYCSGLVALGLYSFAPIIAERWIGDIQTVQSLRLYASFLPVTCLCGVMSGFFTAEKRIGTLAAVEIGEQLLSMAVTVAALSLWAGQDPAKACESVILGNGCGAVLTLCCLVCLRLRERCPVGAPIPVASRLLSITAPLALADVVKAGLNTTENLMVPKRLGLHNATESPLAAFGCVTGMVFPVMMFPACILFGLAELLIPELARCTAAASSKRISYLVQRSLKVALLYGTTFGGLLFLLADPLCLRLYGSHTAAAALRGYALLVPMLYCDAITDAMTKGLGQQKYCVRYNILTSAMDLVGLYFLLPRLGMTGYFLSFAVTHGINFLLSLRRLLRITGQSIPSYIPMLTLSAALLASVGAGMVEVPILRAMAYLVILLCTLYLFGIVRKEDILWLRGLCSKSKS